MLCYFMQIFSSWYQYPQSHSNNWSRSDILFNKGYCKTPKHVGIVVGLHQMTQSIAAVKLVAKQGLCTIWIRNVLYFFLLILMIWWNKSMKILNVGQGILLRQHFCHYQLLWWSSTYWYLLGRHAHSHAHAWDLHPNLLFTKGECYHRANWAGCRHWWDSQ